MSSVRIEAEDYVAYYDRTSGNAGTAADKYSDDVDVYYSSEENSYSIGQTAAGEFLTYTINIAEAGEYRLDARVASAKSFTKKLEILVNDDPVTNLNIVGSTGGWFSWKDVSAEQTVSLPKGTHTLKVRLLTGGLKLNYIDLVRAGDISEGSGTSSGGSDTTGSNAGTGSDTGATTTTTTTTTTTSTSSGSSIKVQAEDYSDAFDTTAGNGGGVYRSGDVDIAAGGGSENGHYVTGIQKTEVLTYEIDVAEAGEYQLNARVAAAGTRLRRFKLMVEGQRVEFGLGFTGGWQSWENITADNTVSLSAGKHTVRLYMVSNGFNFDSFELVQLKTNNPAPVTVRQVDLKIDSAIAAGLERQAVVGTLTNKAVSYAEAVTGVIADLDAGTVTYGVKSVLVDPPSLGRLKIMPLGDSITRGGQPFDLGGYRDDLRSLLANAGYDVDFVGPESLGPGTDNQHAGVGGNSIDQVSARVVSTPDQVGVIKTYKPDAVLLMVGTNDNLRNLDFPNALGRLDRLIGQITSEHPSTHVIVASIPPTRIERKQQLIKKYYRPSFINDVVAKHENATFVDVFNRLDLIDILADDKIHITKQGNTKIAQAWFAGIRKAFSDTSITTATDTLQGITNVIGTDYDDVLIGNDGSNTLVGGGGDDRLAGGNAADRFVLAPNDGFDTIEDFQLGQDLIVLANGLSFDQIDIVSGATRGYGSDDTLLLYNNVKIALLSDVDFTSVSANAFATTSDIVA